MSSDAGAVGTLDGATVVVVSPVVSDPAHSGNTVRTRQICSALQTLGADVHFCLVEVNAIRSRAVGATMHDVWGAAYHRVGDDLAFKGTPAQLGLRKAQSIVRRVPASADWLLDFQVADGFVSRRARREFAALVAELQPTAIVVEYALLSKLVTGLPTGPVLVVDTQDRFTDRKKRLRAEGHAPTWISLTARQERRLLRRFHHVVAIQEEEAQQFRDQLGADGDRVALVDVLVEPVAAAAGDHVKDGPPTIGYIGSDTVHNRNALRAFLDTHWATIRAAVPDARLLVAGSDVAGIEAWATDGVEPLGRVADLGDFYAACTLIINPVQSGSGLKIKSVEALQHTLPLVTTGEGIRGLSDAGDRAILCADLADPTFAENCVALLTDRSRAREMGAAGAQFITERRRRSLVELRRCLGSPRPG